MRIMLGTTGALVLTSLLLVLAPIAGLGTASAATTPKLTRITVGIAPLGTCAAVVLGAKQGLFKKVGLDVRFKTLQVTSALVAGIKSGSVTFGLGAIPPALFEANEQGLGLQVVAAAGGTSSRDGGIMVDANSPIHQASDLAGKNVAVPAIGSFREMTFRSWMLAHGADPESVTFVAIPPGSVISSIQSGNVAAGFVQQPFYPVAVQDGLRTIGNDESTIGPFGTAFLSWFGSASYVQTHPSVARAFATAVAEANAYANKHLKKARAVLPSFAGITAAQAAKTYLSPFPIAFSRSAIKKMAAQSLKFGYIKKPVDLKTLIWPGAKIAK